MTEVTNEVEQLVQAALDSDASKRKEEIKKVALRLASPSEGGDTLLAFYFLIGALDRLGELYRQVTTKQNHKQAAE